MTASPGLSWVITRRGVNNDFLIRSSDPLALLYNDVSPMENHHLAAAFTLMREEPYAFFPMRADGHANAKVRLDIDVWEAGGEWEGQQHRRAPVQTLMAHGSYIATGVRVSAGQKLCPLTFIADTWL